MADLERKKNKDRQPKQMGENVEMMSADEASENFFRGAQSQFSLQIGAPDR